MKYLVTGGCGFIGSHLVDTLIRKGHAVRIVDNLLTSSKTYLNEAAELIQVDIRDYSALEPHFKDIDGVFHLAAIARTPWCIDNPILAYQTNVMGTLHVLEASRVHHVKRVVMTSSNVVHGFMTPYRSSKEALESLGDVYVKMYGMSVVCLRNSNVYGSRQSEQGPSPNVFSALRKSKRDNGFLVITGDGTQSRDFTHVSDIVEAHYLAMQNTCCGVIDLCTGVNHTLNYVAAYFNCPVRYTEERAGDIKHIFQDPAPAYNLLNWKAKITLEEGMIDFFSDTCVLVPNKSSVDNLS
jgi:UDP-glucose 4-epimerase